MKTNTLIAFTLLLIASVFIPFSHLSAEDAESDSDKSKDAKAPDPWANGQRPKYPFKVLDANDEGEAAIKKFRFQKDFKCELFAAEPTVANIVAFTIDEKGRFFVAETFRVGEGVIDNRQHMDWLDEDINSRSVEDRAAFQKRHLGKDVIKELGWASERIRLVEDRAGKGKADFSQVYAEGFDTILDGVGAGILARKGTVWFTNIPNLWMLKEDKNTGKATKKSLHYGYGVRNAFMGHDLHGLRMGPDGRLYFSIGDRGTNVKTTDGRTAYNPDSGSVFRCNPDGTELEIYAVGLRNPQALSFDRYGNLFTGDNNADSGDKARWEYIVEGGDYGWRIGWQYIKQTTALGAWNAEKMWHEQNPEQPKHILPPCGLIAAGPSGNLYYPGTGMPARYNEHFFLCDFTGGITAKIHSFNVQPRGAYFEIVDRNIFMEGCLATDIAWGVNGGIYASDWVEGWTKTGKGRIYRLFEEKSVNEPIVAEVKKLLNDGFEQRSVEELTKLLGHQDLRIRQEAQFALVDKATAGDPNPSISAFENALDNRASQNGRIHAIWGLEMIARKTPHAVDALIPMLEDQDSALRQLSAKMLGERKVEKAAEGIAKLLKDKSLRVRFHAANALGKIGRSDSIPAILEMLRENADKDPFLRHAGVMALAWINDFDAIVAAGKDQSPAVRMAALLAMRRLERSEIGMFCTDKDPGVVLEAARAINDVPISGAMGELAALIETPSYNDALAKRVVNANFRLGTEASANALLKFAQQDAAGVVLRTEAMTALGDWVKPPLRDRITNLFRPIQNVRDPNHPYYVLRPVVDEFLKTAIEKPIPEQVRTAALQAMDKLNLKEAVYMFDEVVADGNMPSATRVAALKALVARDVPWLNNAIRSAANSGDYSLRKEGLALLGKVAPDEASPKLADFLERSAIDNKRFGVQALNEWKGREAEQLVAGFMKDLLDDKLEKELMLDVLEAADKRAKDQAKAEPKKKDETAKPLYGPYPVPYVPPDFKALLEKFEAARVKDNPIDQFKECLAGGSSEAGRKVFFEKEQAGCIRCHKIGVKGGDVGPNLTDLALRTKREYMLESIIDPNKVIAAGFESVFVRTHDGLRISGVVKKDDGKVLVLADGNNITTIQKDNIASRKTAESPMPKDIFKQLTKRELRDLVEFLSNQRTEIVKPKEEDSKHQ